MEEKRKISPEVEAFVMALMVEKGLMNLPVKIQSEIMAGLYDRLDDYLIVNFTKAVPESKKDEFDRMMQDGAPQEEIEKFLKENTDYQKITNDTLVEFKDVFLRES